MTSHRFRPATPVTISSVLRNLVRRARTPPLHVLHGTRSRQWACTVTSARLARHRQVIVTEQQGHGRTADIDRPLRYEQMADDTAALLDWLDIERVDVFGFSMGGGVAWQLVLRHPERVRKLVSGSSSPIRAHAHDMAAANPAATFSPEIFAGTPIETEYQRVAPHPEAFPALVRKVADLTMTAGEIAVDVVQAVAAPTMVIAGTPTSSDPSRRRPVPPARRRGAWRLRRDVARRPPSCRAPPT